MEEATTDFPSNPETQEEAAERFRSELTATYYQDRGDPRVKYSDASYRLILKAYKELRETFSLRHLTTLEALGIYPKVYEAAVMACPEEVTPSMWRGKRPQTGFFKILPKKHTEPPTEEVPPGEVMASERSGNTLKAVAIKAEGNIGEALSALSNFFKE